MSPERRPPARRCTHPTPRGAAATVGDGWPQTTVRAAYAGPALGTKSPLTDRAERTGLGLLPRVVPSGPADQTVEPRSAAQAVVARAASQHVPARAAEEAIGASAAGDAVTPRVTGDAVGL